MEECKLWASKNRLSNSHNMKMMTTAMIQNSLELLLQDLVLLEFLKLILQSISLEVISLETMELMLMLLSQIISTQLMMKCLLVRQVKIRWLGLKQVTKPIMLLRTEKKCLLVVQESTTLSKQCQNTVIMNLRKQKKILVR